MSEQATKQFKIDRVNFTSTNEDEDILAVEEPVEIRLEFGSKNQRIQKNVSVTMRTPGNDKELALGFLFTEGILKHAGEVISVHSSSNQQMIVVELAQTFEPEMAKIERNFYTTSSCGVCGKASIDAIRVVSTKNINAQEKLVAKQLFYSLPNLLKQQQGIFKQTGGIHASALVDFAGEIVMVREDVGRHNALDKLIGAQFLCDQLPLNEHILLLSGRASFELIQKAIMAGISIVAAVGAPSSLAVELAKEFDVTLIGFLKENKFNVYSGAKRLSD
jgi:FdhD protein